MGVFIFLILNYVSPSDKGQCGRFQEGNCKTADPSQRMTDQHDGREFVPELSIPERVSTCYDSVHLASPENGPLVKMHSATVLKLVVPLVRYFSWVPLLSVSRTHLNTREKRLLKRVRFDPIEIDYEICVCVCVCVRVCLFCSLSLPWLWERFSMFFAFSRFSSTFQHYTLEKANVLYIKKGQWGHIWRGLKQ